MKMRAYLYLVYFFLSFFDSPDWFFSRCSCSTKTERSGVLGCCRGAIRKRNLNRVSYSKRMLSARFKPVSKQYSTTTYAYPRGESCPSRFNLLQSLWSHKYLSGRNLATLNFIRHTDHIKLKRSTE